jgi:N-acylneuraminate cytidylyltransferase
MGAIAIIPARGGSKGIPLKNLAYVAGQPLIDWTLEAAQESELIDRIIVSTDNEFIAAHALGFRDVEVIMRPAQISGDNAQIEAAMAYTLRQIPINDVHNLESEIVLLQPTSPIRRPHDIDAAIDQFKNYAFDSLFSATPIFPYVWLPIKEGGYIKDNPLKRAFHSHKLPRLNRQDRRPLLQENGSIYVTRAGYLARSGNRLNGQVGYYRMPPWTAIEIDNYYDVAIAETTIDYYSEVLEG